MVSGIVWARLKLALVLPLAFWLLTGTPALANTYEYDDIGRLEKVTYSDGSTVTYTYDDAGNRSQKVTAGVSSANFVIDDVSISEGGTLVLTVRRNGDNTGAVGVSYASADVTAVSPADFGSVSGTLSYAAGERVKTVSVSSVSEAVYESDETFNLVLSSPTGGATITDGTGVGTILDDDAGPSFSIDDVSVTEGGTLGFTVTKTGLTELSHDVYYATANGTAGSSDYTTGSGTLTFTSGQTTKTVFVPTTQETLIEANETMYVNLSGQTNGSTISDSQGIGTINNDDVNSPPNAVNDNGSTTAYSNTTVYVLSNDSDPEDDTLTIISVTQPSRGVVAIFSSGTTVRYANLDGGTSDSFTYTISDGNGGTDTATVSISISGGGGGGGFD